MASRLGVIGCLMVVAAMLTGGAAVDTYTVGDSLGWQVPPGGSVAYSTWAAGKTFKIGDTISFNWTGTHNVAEVSTADYFSCTTTNTIGSVQSTSPVTINLTTNDTRYFICTVSSHCSLGQKVAIPMGSQSSSAPSLAAGAAVLLALAVSFISHM